MGYRYNPFIGDFDRVDTTTLSPQVPTQFDADTGSAIPALNILNLIGDLPQGISSSGSGNTITYTMADATTTQKGVLETSTDGESIAGTSSSIAVTPESLKAKLGSQTSDGIPYGTGDSAALGWTAALTDGQLVIGSTAGVPAGASLTSADSSITITPGSNTINLATGSGVAASFTTDSGTAIPSSGILNVTGGTLLNTAGATNVVTINADDNVVGSVISDSGTATPTSNAFTIAGGSGCSTSATGSTVTIDLSGGGLPWTEITVTGPTSLSINNGYITNNAGIVGLTLPSSTSIGDVIRVAGKGSGGWSLGQNAGQTIHFGNVDSTTGVGGSIASTNDFDCIELLCITANTDFIVLSSIGALTVI